MNIVQKTIFLSLLMSLCGTAIESKPQKVGHKKSTQIIKTITLPDGAVQTHYKNGQLKTNWSNTQFMIKYSPDHPSFLMRTYTAKPDENNSQLKTVQLKKTIQLQPGGEFNITTLNNEPIPEGAIIGSYIRNRDGDKVTTVVYPNGQYIEEDTTSQTIVSHGSAYIHGRCEKIASIKTRNKDGRWKTYRISMKLYAPNNPVVEYAETLHISRLQQQYIYGYLEMDFDDVC